MDRFTDTENIQPVTNLDTLCKRLNEVFNEDRVNVEYVKALMGSYKSNPKEWRKYAKFDKHRYTRNLVDEGNGKFNLMILCWGEGHASSIHSHAGSHCFLKVLEGQMTETLYEWPENRKSGFDDSLSDNDDADSVEGDNDFCPMKKRERLNFKRNAVTYINDDLGLHKMENTGNSGRAVSLHLYSPPFQECYCFDENSARKIVSKMTFWSRFGERTPFTVADRRTSVDLLRERFGNSLQVSEKRRVCCSNDTVHEEETEHEQ